MLEAALVLGLLNTTLLACFMKWGWLELYQLHRKAWMPDDCILCFGYWMAFIQVLLSLWFVPLIWLLVVPLLATAVTRKMI